MNSFTLTGFRPGGPMIGNGVPFRSGGFSTGTFTGTNSRALSGPFLGQTNQEWYNRAKKATETFADLRDNVLPRIADLRARADIIEWLGSVYVDESPEYRWASVMGDLGQAKDEGIGIYATERRTNRIVKLEDFVDTFLDKIGAAGALIPEVKPIPTPEPGKTIIIERGEAPDIGTPIAIGLGALAFAVLASAVLS